MPMQRIRYLFLPSSYRNSFVGQDQLNVAIGCEQLRFDPWTSPP